LSGGRGTYVILAAGCGFGLKKWIVWPGGDLFLGKLKAARFSQAVTKWNMATFFSDDKGQFSSAARKKRSYGERFTLL
jgi:hypothetical protein